MRKLAKCVPAPLRKIDERTEWRTVGVSRPVEGPSSFTARLSIRLFSLAFLTTGCKPSPGPQLEPAEAETIKPLVSNPDDVIDHFLCSEVTPDFKGPQVKLKDQFQPKDKELDPIPVGERLMLCNPVEKTVIGEPGHPYPDEKKTTWCSLQPKRKRQNKRNALF